MFFEKNFFKKKILLWQMSPSMAFPTKGGGSGYSDTEIFGSDTGSGYPPISNYPPTLFPMVAKPPNINFTSY